jgi:GTP:adenosylcobinamide-phosphate guanylyltransferase
VRVAILCGGKGTRLGAPIKCLAEVAGRPFMDWKLEQLERFGATDIHLLCGPFRSEFRKRYGSRVVYKPDRQSGIKAALGFWPWWWTMGDVLLDQPLGHRNAVYVVRGEQIAGLWLDAGLYHGTGPWQMVETSAVPYHINTPDDLARCEAYLKGAHENSDH